MTSMPPIPRHIIIKHEGEAVEISNSTGGSNNKNKLTIPLNLPLVDEIDLQQCLVSPARPWQASAIQGVVIGKAQLEVICKATVGGGSTEPINSAGSHKPQSSIACPCCRRYIQVNDSRVNIKSGDDAVEIQLHGQQHQQQFQQKESEEPNNSDENATLASRVQAAITTLTMQPSIMQPMAAPPLASGDQLQDYTIKETIVQGWLYKKGTGGDFSGRRWWKPRWITLALAETPNTSTPTPILISHRAPGVPYPASIIELTASTVIMAIERTNGDVSNSKIRPSTHTGLESPSKEEWNRHCFQIVHTHHQDNETTPKTTTRIFTAPMEDRNEWVFAMNNALLGHEKRLSKARSDAAKNDLYMTSNMQTMSKKARHLDGPIFCGAVMESGGEDLPQEQAQTPWTNNSGGRNRMRSPSPVMRRNASMGLPPTNPRRMRSPSPNRRTSHPISP